MPHKTPAHIGTSTTRRMTALVGTMLVVLAVLMPKSVANSQTATPTQAAVSTPAATASDVTPLPGPHSHMIISTNFEMEPLLADYAKAYPNVNFSDYRIVFKAENEWPNTPYTYIIVFSIPSQKAKGIDFWIYLDAWVKLHPGNKAVASAVNDVLPQLKTGYGNRALGF